MTSGAGTTERANEPEDLNRFVVERLNAGDIEGLVALYEPGRCSRCPSGASPTGR